ncbi:hypothetical protein J7J84_02060 [bacterium]|nr:hypothetical protein [bacterium]
MSRKVIALHRDDIALACEFIEQVPYTGSVGLMREIRDSLLAMDEPTRLIRGLFHLLSGNALMEAERGLAQSAEEASSAIRRGHRDTARWWARKLVGQGVCKLVLGEQYGLISAASCSIWDARAPQMRSQKDTVICYCAEWTGKCAKNSTRT